METTKVQKIYVLVKDGIGYIGDTGNCVLLPQIRDNGCWNATVYGGNTTQPHFFLSGTKYEITAATAYYLKEKVKMIQMINRWPNQPADVEWFKPESSGEIPLTDKLYTSGKIFGNLIGKFTIIGLNRLYLSNKEAVEIASHSYKI